MKKFMFMLLIGTFSSYSAFSMGAPGVGYGGASPDGLITFLPIILILIIIGVIGRKNIDSQVLVLKNFTLNEKADEFLRIEGRVGGFFSWILSLCGINPITSLSCNKESIKFEEASIRYGKRTINVPLVAVTGVSSGINKPFGLLVLGIIFALSGIIGAIARNSVGSFIAGLIFGAIFIIIYVLRKTMIFSIYNGGDKPIANIRLEKSIIEGQSIDEQKYESAAITLNNAVLEIHKYLATN